MRRRLIVALAVLTLLLAACTSSTKVAGPTDVATQTPAVVKATHPAPINDAEETAGDGTSTVQGTTCGYVRWATKTGTDKLAAKVDLHPKTTTIAALLAFRSPLPKVSGNKPGPNVGRYAGTAEMQAFTLSATLTEFAGQHDSDIHLVLADSAKHTLIVEIPAPACVKGGPFAAGIVNARKAFLAKYPRPPVYPAPFAQTSQPVTVTGVGFFDYVHGQSGVAGNGVELHPLLSIVFR